MLNLLSKVVIALGAVNAAYLNASGTMIWAIPNGPRPCASRRATLRCLALSAAVAIAGCDADATRVRTGESGGTKTVAIWTDPSTGCNYLFYDEGFAQARVASLSIRFRADGTPDCPLSKVGYSKPGMGPSWTEVDR